ncbi:MAG TPA: F0F1 ATP synthase subunit gamma, partial [Candidatus Portnoybacteria bacterium]|nr:F0F1 ATP synthase subunit gamma [Candidatus Portnoybacteria bacterium]
MSDIQKKISSTKNIQKITKAMQTVAASKMKKSQKKAFDGRPFAIEMLKLLRNISEHTKEN